MIVEPSVSSLGENIGVKMFKLFRSVLGIPHVGLAPGAVSVQDKSTKRPLFPLP